MLITEPLIPAAPIAGLIDSGREGWVMVIMGAAAALTLLASLLDWWRSGQPVALMMFLAGGCAVLHEPLVDLVGGCWHYANARIVYVAYGRPMPLWLCIAYFFYVGIGLSTVWRVLRRGVAPRQIWLLYAGAMLADCIMEVTLLNLDIYAYYGHQPLVLAKFPLWWAPVNAGYIVVTAALIYRLDAFLRGWRTVAIIPISLTVAAAFNAAAGWPAWLVINSDLGPLATQLGGLLTVGIAFVLMNMTVAVIVREPAIAKDSPAFAALHACSATVRATRL